MANVTSVSREITPPRRFGGIVLALVGVLAAAVMHGKQNDSSLQLVSLAMIIAGVVWAATRKPTYHVRMGSASGETQPMSSPNAATIDQIVRAMNEAFIARG
jgi:drug/metabolite transporter (DMT)-like permease